MSNQENTVAIALKSTEPTEEKTVLQSRFWRRFFRNASGVGALIFIILLVLVAIFAPWLAPLDPATQNLRALNLLPFSEGHPLGTDSLGRDTLSRLIYGARITVIAPLIAIGIGAGVGIPLGYIAGFFKGWVDAVIMRLADAIMAFPALILAIAIVAVLGRGITNAMIAVGILFIPRFIRLVRGVTLAESEQTYVEASRSIGSGNFSIIWNRIVPNTTAPLIVQITIGIAFVILTESALSFLGLSVQPPTASWGVMLHTAFTTSSYEVWGLVIPGLCIMLVVVAFNLLGDAINDAFGKNS